MPRRPAPSIPFTIGKEKPLILIAYGALGDRAEAYLTRHHLKYDRRNEFAGGHELLASAGERLARIYDGALIGYLLPGGTDNGTNIDPIGWLEQRDPAECRGWATARRIAEIDSTRELIPYARRLGRSLNADGDVNHNLIVRIVANADIPLGGWGRRVILKAATRRMPSSTVYDQWRATCKPDELPYGMVLASVVDEHSLPFVVMVPLPASDFRLRVLGHYREKRMRHHGVHWRIMGEHGHHEAGTDDFISRALYELSSIQHPGRPAPVPEAAPDAPNPPQS